MLLQSDTYLYGDILTMCLQVRTLDDACVFFLASLPKETFTVAEKVFNLFSTGQLKGQSAKRGTLGRKLDLKGSNFKHVRGLDTPTIHQLLCEVVSEEKSIPEMTAECIKIKRMCDVQQSFILQTGSSSWEEATLKYPAHTTPDLEALDEFLCVAFQPKSPAPR